MFGAGRNPCPLTKDFGLKKNIAIALDLDGVIANIDDGIKRYFENNDLKAEYKPSEQTRFYTDFWIRSFGFPEVSHLSDLSYKKLVDPIDIDIREAYFDVYNFLFKNFYII